MPDLSDLISRVEKASGPDHQLDKMIFAAIRGWSYPLVGSALMESESETRIHGRTNYTASLDAVLTLLPDGYAVTDLMIWPDEPSSATVVGTTRRPFGKDHRMSWVHGAGDGTWRGNGATAPLALLSAILRARQAMQMEAR